jgi:hypothetical protein
VAAKGGHPFAPAAARRTFHRESNRGATFAAKGPDRGPRPAAVPFVASVEESVLLRLPFHSTASQIDPIMLSSAIRLKATQSKIPNSNRKIAGHPKGLSFFNWTKITPIPNTDGKTNVITTIVVKMLEAGHQKTHKTSRII